MERFAEHAWGELGSAIVQHAVAFLYYSGHGENYLIPIGAKIALGKQLPILGVSLSEITRSLERVPAKARFVVDHHADRYHTADGLPIAGATYSRAAA